MKVVLDKQEVMKAINVYMALKGFKTDGHFNFSINPRVGLENITIDVKPKNHDIEYIKDYANRE